MTGVGHYVPDIVKSNADFERTLETSDEWILSRTGMRERRYAPPEMATSDMAIFAAEHALERADLRADQIDCFIVATTTPDYQFPATACLVAARLGAVGKAAFDLEIACSGFIYALPVAASFIRAGIFRRVMVIGAEKLSGITDQSDRSTAILFGDGAGAAVVERSPVDSFLSCDLGADGRSPEMLYVPAGGSREPLTPQAYAQNKQFIRMSGREVYRYAIREMIDSIVRSLERASLTAADITFMVPHQANRRIIDATAKRLSIEPERIVVNIERVGNTSAASIPLALSEMVGSDRLKSGDIVLFVAFGGGLSWGSLVWRWA